MKSSKSSVKSQKKGIADNHPARGVCVKCGGGIEGESVVYVQASFFRGEHLRFQCWHCGYAWREKTRDTSGGNLWGEEVK